METAPNPQTVDGLKIWDISQPPQGLDASPVRSVLREPAL